MNLEQAKKQVQGVLELASEYNRLDDGTSSLRFARAAALRAFNRKAKAAVPALSQLLEAVTWQPIETAPKDKAFFGWDGHNMHWCWWQEDGLDIRDWKYKPGWQVANAGYDGDSNFSDSLILWHPLPSPPEDK